MKKSEYLKKIHKEILTIMDEVVRICDANNIKYYLIGGTLLGAVRHGGFIPWDDDLDLVMPRSEFDKFLNVCEQELNKDFKIEWITTNNCYGFLHAKVCNRKTVFVEQTGINHGIFVDVFPIDTTNGLNKTLQYRWVVINKLKQLMYAKYINCEMSFLKRKILNFISFEKIHKILRKFCTIEVAGDYFTNFGSQYGIVKQTILKEYYGEGKVLKFENRYFRVPLNYDAVLKSIFGDDYMDLPSKDKRITHSPKKVVFSDGEVIEF